MYDSTNHVKIIEYNPLFKETFEREYKRLKEKFIKSDIIHVGSSSLGLPTKPSVNVLVTYMRNPIGKFDWLEQLGYLYIGNGNDHGVRYFFILESEPYNIHLHLVKKDGRAYKNITAFKKLLAEEQKLRDTYVDLKKRLAKMFPKNLKVYAHYKGWFIDYVLDDYESNKDRLDEIIKHADFIIFCSKLTKRML